MMSTADVAHQAAENKTSAADVGGSAVRWDRFLPKMAVRVLLVEADDSTRQIITALLRKCSYRVAAVGDGLKAWELLKGRPNAIDLILTEVELPLISGYALLTLIMEHDICRNIPVIMMSTNDSVSMVYKCMLRGAVDFLVKPVRKNELRNLWQHVWRKQASNSAAGAAGGGPGPPDESVAQQKVEATAENNEASNQSSGFIACVQRNRECIEKGSDAQSSCTKPELENDEDGMAADDMINSDDANSTRQELRRESSETPDEVREAIDLIGAFDANNNCSKGVRESPPSNYSTNGFDTSRRLDLSLRRPQPIDENCRLNHSIASAFSRYVNRPFVPGNSTSPGAQKMDQETDLSNRATNSDISQPIAVRGLRLVEHVINGYGSLAHEMYRSPLPSPRTPNTPKSFPQGGKLYRIVDISADNECVEGGNERGFSNTNNVQEEPSPRSNSRTMQREAALTKFRLKRKDRCFEKKVRYESRKKLAEQRPRVKGQFVRQVPDETQPGNSSAG